MEKEIETYKDRIKVGAWVTIKRTDGREHLAIISSVNFSNFIVTVEWLENKETKGKEIEFSILYELNKNLFPNWPIEDTNIMNRKSLMGQPPNSAYNHNRAVDNTHNKNKDTRDVENIPPSIPAVAQQIPYSSIQKQNMGTTEQPHTNVKKGRLSHVVKEVEKLQKCRLERRQKQAEKKEEKDAIMKIDPGNPNWQFLGMIREYQSTLEYRPLKDSDPVESHQITVCVRKRPLNKKEINKKEVDVLTIPRKNLVIVHEPKSKVDLTKYLDNQQFRFDYAFDESCNNEIVYKFTAKPLVQTVFDGGMATCFAYGQTGSGKTHLMGGKFSGKHQDCKNGIYAMAARDFFKYLHSPQYKQLLIAASFFEIYSGKVFDLLADKTKLKVLEDGKQQVQIVGLTETIVKNVDDVFSLIQAGNQARTSGVTSANSNSSRSHAVFQIILRNSKNSKIHGKFSLIDLAGNERGADTSSANRLTRMEGAEINKSLLALKECIRALGRKGAHLPFRVSKLTQVLRDSFIGDNSRTCMIAMISPGIGSCEHTLNTLRYADRVKELGVNDVNSYNDVMKDQKDDLATLRSLNEQEISTDLLNFHEAVSQLQQTEEEVIDGLKLWKEHCEKWSARVDQLIKQTRAVDYDQEAFGTVYDEVLESQLKFIMEEKEKVKSFRIQLAAEEEISKKIPNSKR